MMHVTFVDHSGFLVELPGLTLLFDWWKGDLPPCHQAPCWSLPAIAIQTTLIPGFLLWMTGSGMSDSFLARASI